jgi:hypothetical protein
MTTSKSDLENRLDLLRKEVLKRGFDRHPSLLKNVSDLPSELQSPTVISLANSESIQTIIAFPQQIHRGWQYVSKQALLFTPTDVIHLLASIWPDQEPQVTHLKGCGLLYMRATLLLLYGFLEIVAQGTDSPTRLGIEFNTVAWDRLSPCLRQLLQASKTTPSAPTDKNTYSPIVQQAIENLPLKFSNGVKIHGLLPGEELEELVFQPGIWKDRWLLFRQPITANTLLLLTSNFMAVIQEELGIGQGWIISYIPLSNIIEVQNQPRSLWNELTIILKRRDQTVEFKLNLSNEAAQAWGIRWVQHGGQWQNLPVQTE